MRIALLSRYPRADTPAWKREVAQALLDRGHELGILYSRSALSDHLRSGIAELGLVAIARYAASAVPRPGSPSSVEESLAAWARARGIPVTRHRRLSDPGCEAFLRAFDPDLIVLAGADIVPPALLRSARAGVINPHYGLLPKYRGMHVTEWSIYHDDRVGVTIHFVSPGIDTGDVIRAETVTVEPGDSLEALRKKHQRTAARLLIETVEQIASGGADAVAQALEEGRQYYRMHPALRAVVERKLASGTYRWIEGGGDSPPSGP